MEQETESAAPKCPQCSGDGLAYKVSVEGPDQTIAFRCSDCGQCWSETNPHQLRPITGYSSEAD